ncbi:uncharacterized protein LOC134837216 [Culicoides brevitarsis]|uniref:uncharacterized protein LOC134837216 n=1 Tax=Culicoides brevitarsis TaxID=469753 RepID=UPI00307B153F
MFLLPFILSTFCVLCHAAIPPEAILPMLLEQSGHAGNAWRFDYLQNVEKLQQMDELLRQYRTYLVNAIYENNNDICNLFDYLTDNNANNRNFNEEAWNHDVNENDNNIKDASRKRRSSNEQPQEISSHHQTAIDMYFEIASIVRDRLFYIELLKKLQHVCATNDSGAYFKRDGVAKVIGKKQTFHSWGGKRESGRGKDPLKDQVIPRSYPPFHSWGG